VLWNRLPFFSEKHDCSNLFDRSTLIYGEAIRCLDGIVQSTQPKKQTQTKFPDAGKNDGPGDLRGSDFDRVRLGQCFRSEVFPAVEG